MENEIKNYCVYKHTSPSNKVYIGITSQEPERRWKNGNGYKKNLYFTKAIKKYGWDNFTHEILYNNLTRDEACRLEIQTISEYQANNSDYGYNLSLGGDLGMTKPISMYSIDGEFIKRFDTVCDACYETGISNNAITNAATGCAMTAGNYIWRYDGDSLDKYPIREYSDYKLYQFNKCKIKQYDFDGNLLNTYIDLKDAAKSTGAQEHYIFIACKGIQNSHHGYVWRFEGDDFNKYITKIKIREIDNALINYDNLKYSNIPIYQYNFDGSINNIYQDVYSIPNIPNKEIYKVIKCINGEIDSYKKYVYRLERDFFYERTGYIKKTKSIKVKQYDLNGNLLNIYNSIAEAQRITGATNVQMCTKGQRKQSGGFVWRCENDNFDKYPLYNRRQ